MMKKFRIKKTPGKKVKCLINVVSHFQDAKIDSRAKS